MAPFRCHSCPFPTGSCATVGAGQLGADCGNRLGEQRDDLRSVRGRNQRASAGRAALALAAVWIIAFVAGEATVSADDQVPGSKSVASAAGSSARTLTRSACW